MKDPIQTILDTKDGILNSFKNAPAPQAAQKKTTTESSLDLLQEAQAVTPKVETGTKLEDLNGRRETLADFETKISVALMGDEREVETSEEVIKYLNPRGLGIGKYFIYKGVKVYPQGTRDAIQAEESVQISQRLHGAADMVLERG